MSKHLFAIALDMGGTAIKSALISQKGVVEREFFTPSSSVRTPEELVALLVHLIQQYRLTPGIVGIGLGSPGPLDPYRGIIHFTPNLPFKKPFPIVQKLRAKIALPVFLQNDANVAALGEGWQGAAQGAKVVVMFTLGTGIGGGVLINGKIFDGAEGQGTELGHFRFDSRARYSCGAQHPGCFEAYVNSQALVRNAKRILGSHIQNPRDIYRLAQRGDPKAKSIFQDYGKALAAGCATVINIFNPEVVLFGGAISGAWRYFSPALTVETKLWAFHSILKHTQIKPAKLGNRAGMFGAAKLVFDSLAK